MLIQRLASNQSELAYDAITNIKHRDDATIKNCLTVDYLRSFLSDKRNYLFVSNDNNRVIGFLLAYRLQRVDRNQDFMFFYEIEIVEGHRGQGIGAQLINELKAICRKENVMKMWVETNRSNVSAMRLYSKTGGKESSSGDEVSFTYYPPFE